MLDKIRTIEVLATLLHVEVIYGTDNVISRLGFDEKQEDEIRKKILEIIKTL